jgi:hypothetical protein
VDAEGCFNVYIPKSVKGVNIRFIVDQQYGLSLFKEIKDIFGSGSIYARKNENYRLTLANLNTLPFVIEYFDNYALRTKKQLAFKK